MFVKWKIEHTPYNDDTKAYDLGTSTLTEYFNPIINAKLGDGRDSFKLDVKNVNNEYDESYNPNDKVIISRVINTSSFTSSDVKMNGVMRDIPEEKNYSKNNIKITGYNYTETIMGTIIPILDATSLDVAEAIQQGLIVASSNNSNFGVTWNSTTNITTKEDGSSFPTVGKIFYYKTLKDIIEELSSKTLTEDGNYYWFVDKENKLVWLKRVSSINYTFNDSTDFYSRIKVGKDSKDVKNFIIMKGGTDAKGSPISNLSPDYASIATHGFKYYIYTSTTTVAGDLIDADVKATVGSDSGTDELKTYIDTYGYTVPWKINGVANNYSSFDDYNSGLRTFIKQELKKEGQILLDSMAYGTLTVSIDRSPLDGEWGLGDVIDCTISNIGEVSKTLRVEEVQYTTELDTYTLKEDYGTI